MTAPSPPRSCLLFTDPFHHDRLCQHVDEVRFTEPVIITACEVVELHQSSLCPTLALKGTTSPESCALEFYVRSGRDPRFQRLGPPFLHSPAATSFLDVQGGSFHRSANRLTNIAQSLYDLFHTGAVRRLLDVFKLLLSMESSTPCSCGDCSLLPCFPTIKNLQGSLYPSISCFVASIFNGFA